jgi:hypothetical protein
VSALPPDLPKGAPIFVKISGVLTKATYHSWSEKYSMPLVVVDGRVMPRKIFDAPPESMVPDHPASEPTVKQAVPDTSTGLPSEPAESGEPTVKVRETRAESAASFGKGQQPGQKPCQQTQQTRLQNPKKVAYPITVGTRYELRKDGHYDIFNCLGDKVSELRPTNIGSREASEERAIKARVED